MVKRHSDRKKGADLHSTTTVPDTVFLANPALVSLANLWQGVSTYARMAADDRKPAWTLDTAGE